MLKRGLGPDFWILSTVIAIGGCAQRPEADEAAADESQATTLRSPSVALAAHHDESPPLYLITPAERQAPIEHEPMRIPRGPSGHFASLPRATVQTSVPPLLMPATSVTFDGVGQGFTGPAGTFSVASAPPDTNGDIGLNHYLQIVNTDFAIFNKTGTVLFGPVTINTLWSGFGGGCQTNNDGDPIAIYDAQADRWVISQFSVTTKPYTQCVAVSKTGDPTGQYWRYSFDYGNTDFNDYPKTGVWPDAYYTTYNIFANATTFSGAKVCAFDRARMLNGQPPRSSASTRRTRGAASSPPTSTARGRRRSARPTTPSPSAPTTSACGSSTSTGPRRPTRPSPGPRWFPWRPSLKRAAAAPASPRRAPASSSTRSPTASCTASPTATSAIMRRWSSTTR
jgi:hypothetical protein